MLPELSPTSPIPPNPLGQPTVEVASVADAFEAKAEQERQARAVYASMEQMHASISQLK